ncbi:hypothetical protein [Sphingomonas prati]|uniref:Uncharacterized protein n=1 Tax=Sphingomonas prati TaxID=1843237 RepID=A0A7W9BUZ3_9SPHN|nr:hypothetical protein [Sphingomonas prati]MBB5730602.1 hypothetical protein [Sphingomonas prati]GGE95266.1 hypothetical protein GCM10011404_30510 [Sphingomonas prati]
MSLEPWPPLYKRPELRMRLIRLVIVGTIIVIVAGNLIAELRG